MKFTYLTDDTERSLAPFFSPFMMKVMLNSVLIVAALVILFWPWQHLFSFVSRRDVPTVFFKIFMATLIITSYINLRCGRGEMVKVDFYTKYYQKEAATREKEHEFFRYGFVEFLLHSLILLLPFLPILLLATAISGLSMLTFAQGLYVLFGGSLCCRLFSFSVYLIWGRFSATGYFMARVIMIVFLVISATFAPVANPILILYELNNGLQTVGIESKYIYQWHIAIVAGLIIMLTVVNQLVIHHLIRKEAHQ